MHTKRKDCLPLPVVCVNSAFCECQKAIQDCRLRPFSVCSFFRHLKCKLSDFFYFCGQTKPTTLKSREGACVLQHFHVQCVSACAFNRGKEGGTPQTLQQRKEADFHRWAASIPPLFPSSLQLVAEKSPLNFLPTTFATKAIRARTHALPRTINTLVATFIPSKKPHALSSSFFWPVLL